MWERYTNDWLRTSVSTYWYKADGLITLAPDPSTFLGTTFVNGGQVSANGLELEAQMRLDWRAAGVDELRAAARRGSRYRRSALVNSPAQMGKMRVSIPAPLKGSYLSGEVLAMSSRRTVAGGTLGAAATVSLTLVAPVTKRLELLATARNLFDVLYADPASDAHRQDSIPQNGRTLRVGLNWKLWDARP